MNCSQLYLDAIIPFQLQKGVCLSRVFGCIDPPMTSNIHGTLDFSDEKLLVFPRVKVIDQSIDRRKKKQSARLPFKIIDSPRDI